MNEWTPLGLGGYGNMLTPAMGPSFGEFPLMVINCDMGGAYASIDNAKSWHLLHYQQLAGTMVCKPAFNSDGTQLFAASGNLRLRVASQLDHQPGDWQWAESDKVKLPTGGTMDGFPERLFGEIAIDPLTGLMLVSTTNDFDFPGYGFIGKPVNCAGIGVSTKVSHIWRSEDGGATWEQAEAPDNLGFILGFHVDQRDESETIATRRCYAAAQLGILASHDGGKTWEPFDTTGLPISPTRPLRSMAAGSRPQSAGNSAALRLYVSITNTSSGADVGLFRRKNDDAWKPCPVNGIDTTSNPHAEEDGTCERVQFHHLISSNHSPDLVHAFHAGTGFVEPFQTGAFRSGNGGDNWEAIIFSDPRMPHCNVNPDWESARTHEGTFEPGNGIATSPDDPNRLLVVGTRAHVRDGTGVNWRAADSPIPNPAEHPPLGWTCNGLVVTAAWHYVIDPHHPSRHYIAYTDIGFARSLDEGETWLWGGSRKVPWQNTVYEILIDPDGPARMWAAFSSIHDIPNGNVVLFWQGIIPEEDKQGRVGFSDDHGQSWTYITDGLDDRPVTCLARAENGDLYAGVWERGVFKLPTGSTQWEPVNAGLGTDQNRRVWRLQIHPNGTLFALITANTKLENAGTEQAFANFDAVNDGVGLYRFNSVTQSWKRLGLGGIEGATAVKHRWPRDFVVDPSDADLIYIAATEPGFADTVNETTGLPEPQPDEAGIFRLRKADDVWERLESPDAQNRYRYFGVYLHPSQPDWIYMTLNGEPGRHRSAPGLWLSKDRGKTFQPFNSFAFKHVHRVFVDADPTDPNDEGVLYVVTNGAGVWRGPATPA